VAKRGINDVQKKVPEKKRLSKGVKNLVRSIGFSTAKEDRAHFDSLVLGPAAKGGAPRASQLKTMG
jgi:hypothetical protein